MPRAFDATDGRAMGRSGPAPCWFASPAVRSVALAETPRGPVSLDDHGHVACDVDVRRAEKQSGKMANRTIKPCSKVSRFWTMESRKFLEQPVDSRDCPPMKGYMGRLPPLRNDRRPRGKVSDIRGIVSRYFACRNAGRACIRSCHA